MAARWSNPDPGERTEDPVVAAERARMEAASEDRTVRAAYARRPPIDLTTPPVTFDLIDEGGTPRRRRRWIKGSE